MLRDNKSLIISKFEMTFEKLKNFETKNWNFELPSDSWQKHESIPVIFM